MEEIETRCIFKEGSCKEEKKAIIKLFELYVKVFLEEEYINRDIKK